MSNYVRSNIAGGCYFFTVVSYKRQTILCHPAVRAALKSAIQQVRIQYPFNIHAWVLMPDHLHCIWQLPENDNDYAKRWGMIKRSVTQQCQSLDIIKSKPSESRQKRHESGLWQRRYWEHFIRNKMDYQQHFDYTHWNPVKHGIVSKVSDWPHSTFHRYVKEEIYPEDWGGNNIQDAIGDYGE